MSKEIDPNGSCRQNCPALRQLNLHYHYFVSKLSHEIRNPLTLVYSSLQLMEKEQPLIGTSPLWAQIKYDLEDTLRLLADLSSLNNSGTLQPEPLDLQKFLGETAASCRSFLQQHKIFFTLQTGADLPMISADRRRLKEALLNLIHNAADALSCKEENRRLILAAAACRDFVQIHVRDNGCGIPAEYRGSILEPFVTHKPNGTGLGLAIAKSIVSHHGGALSFTTSTDIPETFTDFCITLPAGALHSEGKEPAQ